MAIGDREDAQQGPMAMVMRGLTILAFVLAIALALGFVWMIVRGSLPATTFEPGRQVVIAVDLSQSHPALTTEVYAARAGQRVYEELRDLPLESTVKLRSFGRYADNDGVLAYEQIISINEPLEKVRSTVRRVIASLPQLVEDGRLTPSDQSSPLSFLRGFAQSIDCEAAPTRFILISQGLERSELADLTDENASLPLPAEPIYAGCTELMVIGVGRGQDSILVTERLTQEWSRWAEAAGFERFLAVSNW